MNHINPFKGLALLVFLTVQDTWGATSPTILEEGHNPVEVFYEDDSWSFFIDGSETGNGRLQPDEAVLHLTETTRLTIPDNPNFAFLGEPGAPVWIAPHIERPGVLLLGISGERIAPNAFRNDRLDLRLISVKGPGSFAIYGIDSSGQVSLFHDSSDGIDGQDVAPFGIGGHDHQNWAFNAPGIYEVTFRAEGNLQNGMRVESDDVSFRFAVGDVDPNPPSDPVLIDEGDADVALVWTGDNLFLEVFWGARDQAFSVDEALYLVKPNSRMSVPADPAFSFLGSPGETVWVGPQADVPGKLFLALAGDMVPPGQFVGDVVRVTMNTFEGPGGFSVYETDSFGTPTVYFNTSDGISDEDSRDVVAGEHYHMNWGFTQPGDYIVGFEASGVLNATGEAVTAPTTNFRFRVAEPEPAGVSLTARRVSAELLTIEWVTEALTEYQLQSRSAVAAGEWENEGTPIQGNGETSVLEIPIDTSNPARFYRILRL